MVIKVHKVYNERFDTLECEYQYIDSTLSSKRKLAGWYKIYDYTGELIYIKHWNDRTPYGLHFIKSLSLKNFYLL